MILKNARLIPALSQGVDLENASIHIEGKTIRKIAPEIAIPGEQVLDLQGRTVLPGFIDLHTHLTGLNDETNVDAAVPMKTLIGACKTAGDFLDYGFTTIRDCGSFLRAAVYAREMEQRGLIDAPRILACGLIINPTENGSDNAIEAMDAWGDGVVEMRRMARREFAEGADFLKILASGSAFQTRGVPKMPIMMPDEIAELVRVAEMKGSYVAAHAHSDASIRACIDLGAYTIEHATYLSEDSLDALLKRENCYLVPTLAAMYCNPGSDSPFWRERLGAMLEACGENLGRAYRAGCKIGFGTDSAPGKGQYAHGIEFLYRRDYMGGSNIDILLQATKYSAEIAGIGDETGVVAPGYTADLAIVNGRPDEDISVVCQKPDYVFRAGKLVRKNHQEGKFETNPAKDVQSKQAAL